MARTIFSSSASPVANPAGSMLGIFGSLAPVPSTGTEPQSIPKKARKLRRRPRIATYSPGMVGFGHIRRNASIAQALSESALRPAIVMIAEAWQAGSLPMPDGVDCITFPALRKDVSERKRPRFLRVSDQELHTLRANIILSAIETFDPDVLIVDHLPLGAACELVPTLERLRGRAHTKCVLGMRDVLQDEETVRRSWTEGDFTRAVNSYYDAVWIYCDPAVQDPVEKYEFPEDIRHKVRYAGYLDQQSRLPSSQSQNRALLETLPEGRMMLCAVGGGHDGGQLAECFVKVDLPPDAYGVLIEGPFMNESLRARLRKLAEKRRQMLVFDFLPDPIAFVERADRVVSMGGYNTVCELLSFDKDALIVPRVDPKPEQWIRAKRLCDLGFVDVLRPEELTPAALGKWLAREKKPRLSIRSSVDLDGLRRIPAMLDGLLAGQA